MKHSAKLFHPVWQGNMMRKNCNFDCIGPLKGSINVQLPHWSYKKKFCASVCSFYVKKWRINVKFFYFLSFSYISWTKPQFNFLQFKKPQNIKRSKIAPENIFSSWFKKDYLNQIAKNYFHVNSSLWLNTNTMFSL